MSNGGRRWNQRYGGSIADQYLRDNGLRKKSVPRDGCCLFRAVAEQVNAPVVHGGMPESTLVDNIVLLLLGLFDSNHSLGTTKTMCKLHQI